MVLGLALIYNRCGRQPGGRSPRDAGDAKVMTGTTQNALRTTRKRLFLIPVATTITAIILANIFLEDIKP